MAEPFETARGGPVDSDGGEHVSDLVLDELAASLEPPAGAAAHLAGCPACSRRLADLCAARERIQASVGYARVRARLAPRKSARWPFLVVPVAAAALLALVVARPEGQATRPKGSARVELLGANGAPVLEARPGERVVLAIGSGGKPFGLVLGVDERGQVERLWPVDAARAGAVPPGARVRLEPSFEVTAGSVALHAFFGEAPIDERAARGALEAEVESARRVGRSPLEVSTPATVSEETARTTLRVAP